MTMLTTQIKKKKETKAINFKLPTEEFDLIQKQADKYTNGNLTAWLKYSGTYCRPDPKHLVKPSKPKK